jgi:PD-(D/E)XK nuclease superfamily
MGNDLIHAEISESIIGAAMTVLNTLRPGLDEKIYENALVCIATIKIPGDDN